MAPPDLRGNIPSPGVVTPSAMGTPVQNGRWYPFAKAARSERPLLSQAASELVRRYGSISRWGQIPTKWRHMKSKLTKVNEKKFIRIATLNCRGLADVMKREDILKWAIKTISE